MVRLISSHFVGGCNSLSLVDGIRYGFDLNAELIAMWNGLLADDERYPREISKELYNTARYRYKKQYYDESFPIDLVGWIGWMGSFNGRFFDGGYSGYSAGRDYPSEQIRNTLSQLNSLRGVVFRSGSYNDQYYPDKSIIYCDPPYAGTKQYSVSRNFDYDEFWEWCRYMTKMGHNVFISEYNAPDDFRCVWSKEITNAMNTTKTYKPIEKLFIYERV